MWWRQIILLEKNNFCFREAGCKRVVSLTVSVVFNSLSYYLFHSPVCVLLLGEAKHICRNFFVIDTNYQNVCSALDATMQDVQLSMCESWLIGGYYYKYIGSWETERIFLKECFVLVWFLTIMDSGSESS